jgi:hypothetical protein
MARLIFHNGLSIMKVENPKREAGMASRDGDRARIMRAAERAMRPRFVTRFLLSLTTRPFHVKDAAWLRSPLAQALAAHLMRNGWSVRVAPPRNYLFWRQEELMAGSDTAAVVLPELFGPLTRGEWTALCLFEMARRLECVDRSPEGEGALQHAAKLDERAWQLVLRQEALESDGMTALADLPALLQKMIFPAGRREIPVAPAFVASVSGRRNRKLTTKSIGN